MCVCGGGGLQTFSQGNNQESQHGSTTIQQRFIKKKLQRLQWLQWLNKTQRDVTHALNLAP